MNSVLKLQVCHFSYVTLVTEGALIIFFPEKNRQGALIGAGALNGANTVYTFYKDLIFMSDINLRRYLLRPVGLF